LIDNNDDDLKDNTIQPLKVEEPINQNNGYYNLGIDNQFPQTCYADGWNQINEGGYYHNKDVENSYPDHLGYSQQDFGMQPNPNYQMNPGMVPSNPHGSFANNQANYQIKNNSNSSMSNIDPNLSHSEENEMTDMFNRTKSVRLVNHGGNSGAMTSRLNNSYESGGILDDEEFRQSNRSYYSSGSRGSNPNFKSTCARTFTSSGGVVDQNNFQLPLTYDMQQMNSSFDIGNDPSYNSYRLTPRQISDYSYRSGQFYNPNNQFDSFHGFTRNNSDQYATMSYEEQNTLRNCYSVASLE
jgi:hypothetical protein